MGILSCAENISDCSCLCPLGSMLSTKLVACGCHSTTPRQSSHNDTSMWWGPTGRCVATEGVFEAKRQHSSRFWRSGGGVKGGFGSDPRSPQVERPAVPGASSGIFSRGSRYGGGWREGRIPWWIGGGREGGSRTRKWSTVKRTRYGFHPEFFGWW